jgi:hypothetical protein
VHHSSKQAKKLPSCSTWNERGQGAASFHHRLAELCAVAALKQMFACIERDLAASISTRERDEYRAATGCGRLGLSQSHYVLDTELGPGAGEPDGHTPWTGIQSVGECDCIYAANLVRDDGLAILGGQSGQSLGYRVRFFSSNSFVLGSHRLSQIDQLVRVAFPGVLRAGQ